jgi:hypothetical protein
LSGNGTLWRLASTETGGQNPSISGSAVDSMLESLMLPPFTVNLYELS